MFPLRFADFLISLKNFFLKGFYAISYYSKFTSFVYKSLIFYIHSKSWDINLQLFLFSNFVRVNNYNVLSNVHLNLWIKLAIRIRYILGRLHALYYSSGKRMFYIALPAKKKKQNKQTNKRKEKQTFLNKKSPIVKFSLFRPFSVPHFTYCFSGTWKGEVVRG